ncbi:cardiolipin synthase A, partial [Schumannella luteola]
MTAWVTLITLFALILLDVGVRVAALIIVPRNRRPQTAMAWLLAIFFIPYLGILFFLLFGSARLPKSRRRKQYEINEYILETTEGIDLVRKDPTWPTWLEPLVELNRELGAMPLVGGNSARMWKENQEAFDAMAAEIRRAKRVVHVEFYILSLDDSTRDFFEALAEARARGVKVRVLLDHLGNAQYPGFRRTKRFLTDAGIEWHLMLPLQPLKGRFQRPDLRNHRKLLVVDGEVGFTGSANVIETPYQKKKNHKR